MSRANRQRCQDDGQQQTAAARYEAPGSAASRLGSVRTFYPTHFFSHLAHIAGRDVSAPPHHCRKLTCAPAHVHVCAFALSKVIGQSMAEVKRSNVTTRLYRSYDLKQRRSLFGSGASRLGERRRRE